MKARIPPKAEILISLLFVLFDGVAINYLFLGVFYFWLPGGEGHDIYVHSYLRVRHLLYLLFVVFGIFFNLFQIRAFKPASNSLFNATATMLSTFVTFNVLLFFWRPLEAVMHTFPRPIMLLSTILSIVCIFFLRMIFITLFQPKPLLKKAIIVGNETDGKRILKQICAYEDVRFNLVGVFSPNESTKLASEVIFHQVTDVIVTDSQIPMEEFWAQIYFLRKTESHVFKIRTVFDISKTSGAIDLSSVHDLPLHIVSSHPLSLFQRMIKKAFDISFSIFAIIISFPIMLFAAILVKIDSPGPIFYRQKRVGRFGKEFQIIKFRSMFVEAEKDVGPQIATAQDPRITRVGAYLRKMGIDELPQFFSVLIGDMSVVGPRPERPFFIEKHLEFQGRRLAMKPGVTGLAAVNSRFYLRLTDKVVYDYFYLDKYSFLLDIKIIFQTIWVLFVESKRVLNEETVFEDKQTMKKPDGQNRSEKKSVDYLTNQKHKF